MPDDLPALSRPNPVQPLWQPDEFGFVRALLLAMAVVSALIGALASLPARGPPDAIAPVMLHLIEPQPSDITTVPSRQAGPYPGTAGSVVDNRAETASTSVPDIVEQDLAPPPQLIPAEPAIVLPKPDLTQPLPGARPAPGRLLQRQPSPLRMDAGKTATSRIAKLPAATPLSGTPPVTVQQFEPSLAADTSSGLGPYRHDLHLQVERNIAAGGQTEVVAETGTAVVEAVIWPDGQVTSAHIQHRSGSRAIDQVALSAVQRGGFRPFGPHMPTGPITISVPVTIVF